MKDSETQVQIDTVTQRVANLSSSFNLDIDVEFAIRERLGLDAIVAGQNPVGTVLAFAGTTAPSGWLMCDGSAVSRTTYRNLFALVETTYGVGDGSTTFGLPDLRGKVIAGFWSGSANFGNFGATVGNENHTLTVSEIPSHDHPGTYSSLVWNLNGANGTNSNTAGGLAANTTPGIVPQGGGQAHNNIQPSTIMSYLIKY